MSTLSVATIQNTGSGAPVFKESGGTEIGQIVKAWINFQGTGTVAIRDSFNFSSLTDNGTGEYTVAFSNAFSNNDFCAVADAGGSSGIPSTKIVVTDDADFSTTGFRMQVLNTTGNGGVADFNVNCIMVLGDN